MRHDACRLMRYSHPAGRSPNEHISALLPFRWCPAYGATVFRARARARLPPLYRVAPLLEPGPGLPRTQDTTALSVGHIPPGAHEHDGPAAGAASAGARGEPGDSRLPPASPPPPWTSRGLAHTCLENAARSPHQPWARLRAVGAWVGRSWAAPVTHGKGRSPAFLTSLPDQGAKPCVDPGGRRVLGAQAYFRYVEPSGSGFRPDMRADRRSRAGGW